MTIDELAKKVVAETSGEVSEKEAVAFLKALPVAIKTAVKNGEEVEIYGIGRFTKNEKAAYVGRNPRTGEKVEIPAKSSVAVKLFPKFKKI